MGQLGLTQFMYYSHTVEATKGKPIQLKFAQGNVFLFFVFSYILKFLETQINVLI